MRSPNAPDIIGLLCTTLVTLTVASTPSWPADDRPDPAAPQRRSQDQPAGQNGGDEEDDGRLAEADQDAPPGYRSGAEGGRPVLEGMVPLAFKDASVDETFSYIAEATGKVVIPISLVTLQQKKITLLVEGEVPRGQAIDLLFQAFRYNDVGVIERDDIVIIGPIDQIVSTARFDVIPSDVSVMQRRDKGTIVLKIFKLKNVKAEEVSEQLGENLPTFAAVGVDPNSNQIMVRGDIALVQHMSQLIEELDHLWLEPKTATFRLAYADAEEVMNNILDLYESTGTSSAGSPRQQRQGRPQRGGSPQTPPIGGVGPEIELRVTVNSLQNSVTVYGSPVVVDDIARQIDEHWDLPRAPGTSKLYTLRYTDPIKIADTLAEVLGGGRSTAGGQARGGRGIPGGAAGGGTSVEQMLSGIYQISPLPESNQLLVFSKTESSLDFLDTVIESIDQRTDIGLPFVIALKHASAIELSEQLNALLAEAGTGFGISGVAEGLTGEGFTEEGAGGAGADTGGAGSAEAIEFPWQRGGGDRDDRSPESQLLGRVRIVPISRQNALAVLCPPPYRESIEELIVDFDRPGRQVMISAIIAEVELNDDLALGWRLSSSESIFASTFDDFQVGGSLGFEGTEDNPFNLFDTSVLSANLDLNVVIQALHNISNLRILQEPVVFTADNQEAYFFDGQEIPFIENTTINAQGNPTDSFSYKDVGVILNVRPRITIEHDVDLEINLELSSVVPGQTLFGGAIVDRRQTRTHIIVRNGQTIVLSGILKDSESVVERRLPILGDIPFIGEFFKSRENSKSTSELIAFITPLVVDNPTENDVNFNEGYRGRLEEVTRPLREQVKDLEDNPENIRERLLPSRRIPGVEDQIDPMHDDPRRPLEPEDETVPEGMEIEELDDEDEYDVITDKPGAPPARLKDERPSGEQARRESR